MELIVLAVAGLAFYVLKKRMNPPLPPHLESKAPTGSVIRPQEPFNRWRSGLHHFKNNSDYVPLPRGY